MELIEGIDNELNFHMLFENECKSIVDKAPQYLKDTMLFLFFMRTLVDDGPFYDHKKTIFWMPDIFTTFQNINEPSDYQIVKNFSIMLEKIDKVILHSYDTFYFTKKEYDEINGKNSFINFLSSGDWFLMRC